MSVPSCLIEMNIFNPITFMFHVSCLKFFYFLSSLCLNHKKNPSFSLVEIKKKSVGFIYRVKQQNSVLWVFFCYTIFFSFFLFLTGCFTLYINLLYIIYIMCVYLYIKGTQLLCIENARIFIYSSFLIGTIYNIL